ncbi:hypothetical protein E3A20_04860 [Planctomyces bekefii]|uniref:GLUG domain-containing protein n=1 Tax=Planctomyces bekefii TaxID=1653850 RepID=A0A5C6MBC8_9PLAN|nr:hypothetical protein E3A20_04860 [Planctomyces bekefii]
MQLANPAQPLELQKSDLDFSQRPLQNITFNGQKGKGYKIRMMDDSTVATAQDNLGLFGNLTCSVVANVNLEIGDGTTANRGMRKGSSCVGGLVGILRRGLVSNSSVIDPNKVEADPARHIKGITGTGGIIGCIDNPAFWRSRVTSVFADVIIESQANTSGESVVAGGIVGINKGKIDDATSSSTILAYMQSVAPHAFGGIAGWSATQSAQMSDVHNATSATLKEKAGSLTVGNGGGLVGMVESGPQVGGVAGSSIANSTSSGTVNLSGESVGGLIGLVGRPTAALSQIVDSNPDTSLVPKPIMLTQSYNEGSITGGDKVGGLIGYINGTVGQTTVNESFNAVAPIEASSLPTVKVANPAQPNLAVGGLVGHANNLQLTNSYNLGSAPKTSDLTGAGSSTDNLIGKSTGSVTANANTFFDNTKEPMTTAVSGVVSIPTATIIGGGAPVVYTVPPFNYAMGSVPGLATTDENMPTDKGSPMGAYNYGATPYP